MGNVQKIREEVVRMHNLLPVVDGDNISLDYADRICTTLEMYIDSLQEEPVSEDLEEVAEHLSKIYAGEGSADPKREGFAFYIGFKNGAKWQKQQDQSTIELAEDHAMLAGMEKMKEQMMKDAVDMMVGYWMPNGLMLAIDETENCYNIDDGDRVKVILIKED